MVRKKKPFIDKKNSTRYKLVHRSQHDPLAADEDSNQIVLKELADGPAQERDARRAAQQQCGIYYDDDYDYMQHVRERDQPESVVWEAAAPTRPGKVVLPPSVLPSREELPVGLLNLAAPRGLDLSLDPDIVAALDDDFDFDDPEGELEDDFIALAEGEAEDDDSDGEEGAEEGSEEETEEEETEEEGGDSEVEEEGSDVDSLFSDDHWSGSDGEPSRFTEYSVSSSVLPRNEGLTMLDNRFEEMYKGYDDLGAAEEPLRPVDELIPSAHVKADQLTTDDMLLRMCSEFEETRLSDSDTDTDMKGRILNLASRHEVGAERKELVTEEPDRRDAKWDCETILSTYSNIYNHPHLIELPRKIKLNKSGMVVKEDEGSTAQDPPSDHSDDDHGDEEQITISNYRTKTETAEEKRQRKKAVKESQRARRQVKKATKEVFKEEGCREKKQGAGQGHGKVIKL